MSIRKNSPICVTSLSFVTIALVIGIICHLFGSENAGEDDSRTNDPLFILYKTYLEDVEKKGKADLVWVDRFIAAAGKDASSHGRLMLLYEALGISNSSEDFERSKQIIELITKIQPDENKKILMIGELGEVEREQCLAEKLANNSNGVTQHAKKSIDGFAKYKEAVEKIPLSSGGLLRQRYLMYASMAGRLARDELGDQQTALQFYNTALEMIRQEPDLPDGAFSVGLGYDLDHFLLSKAETLIESEKYDEAEQVMNEYGETGKLSSSGLPHSVYALEVAVHALVVKNKDLTNFLEKWVQTKPRDSKTFACVLYVARKKLESGDIDAAQKYYESIRENYWEDVLKSSVAEFVDQDLGYISQTLGDLSDIYLSKRDMKKSEECQAELRKLLPKYNDEEQRVKVMLPSAEGGIAGLPPKKSHAAIMVIVVNVMLVAIIVLRLFTLKRQRNTKSSN